MKYIKTFENNIDSKKLYVIIKNYSDNDDYEMYYLPIGVFNTYYLIEYYDRDLNEIIEWRKSTKNVNKQPHKRSYDFIYDNGYCEILYETDNYDNAHEKLELISSAEKYNL
jgi:hypothetical protein